MGSFKLMVQITDTVHVPAHKGTMTRDNARKLKKLYKLHRPDRVTRVVKA